MTSTKPKTRNDRLPDGSRVVRLIGVDPAADRDWTVLTYLVQLPNGHYRTWADRVPGTVALPNQADSNKED